MAIVPTPITCNAETDFNQRFFHNSFVLLACDTAALLVAVWMGSELLYRLRGVVLNPFMILPVVPMWWLGAALLRLVPGWGLGPVERLRRTEYALLVIFGMLLIALFVARVGRDPSRIAYFTAYFMAAFLVPLSRAGMKAHLLRQGRWGLPVVVYGNDRTAEQAVRAMREEPSLGYMPVGIFDDDQPTGGEIDGIPVLGDTWNVTDAAPVAVLAAPAMASGRLGALLDGPLARYRKVIILPEILDIPTLWVQPCDFLGVLGLEVSRKLLDPSVRTLKNILELLGVVITLPVWGVMVLGLALLIRLEDGERPFFSQKRIGLNGRVFRVIKFRTMHMNAEDLLRKQLEKDEDLRAEWRDCFKLKNDPRITRMGRFLRRTSLDEIPQLFNVLAGQMALVGPRPLPLYHHNRLPERTRVLRERVRPGLTGLWQVSGRSEIGNAGIERWDSYYVRNWSLWLDIMILARTVRVVLSGRGAY